MRKVLLVALGIAAAGFVGCNQDDDDHDHAHVTITFDEPTNGEVIASADAGAVHVHIEFVSDEEVHDIEIKLHPEGDANDLIIDHDHHAHAMTYTFMQDVDLSSYAAGTEFHLEAKAYTDHDGNEFEEADIHFELGQ
jgi:hypothetical protein